MARGQVCCTMVLTRCFLREAIVFSLKYKRFTINRALGDWTSLSSGAPHPHDEDNNSTYLVKML